MPGVDIKAAVLCSTGEPVESLLSKDELQSQVTVHEIEANPAAPSCSLSLPGYSVTLTFTDNPIPPEEASRTTASPSWKTGWSST